MAENNNKISNKKLLSEENNNLKEKKIKTGIFEHQFMSLMGSFNPTPQLSEDNINKLIENDDKHDERKFRDKREIRITAIIIIAIIMFIIFMFKDNIELLKDILIPIILLFFTAIGGYGYGYKKGKDADD